MLRSGSLLIDIHHAKFFQDAQMGSLFHLGHQRFQMDLRPVPQVELFQSPGRPGRKAATPGETSLPGPAPPCDAVPAPSGTGVPCSCADAGPSAISAQAQGDRARRQQVQHGKGAVQAPAAYKCPRRPVPHCEMPFRSMKYQRQPHSWLWATGLSSFFGKCQRVRMRPSSASWPSMCSTSRSITPGGAAKRWP